MNTLYEWEKATEENILDNKEYYYDEVGCELKIKGRVPRKSQKIKYWEGKDYIRVISFSSFQGQGGKDEDN